MKQQAIQCGSRRPSGNLVVSVRDAQGTVVTHATVSNEATAIVGLIRGLGGRVHVAFEESTQAQWLHDIRIARIRAA